MLKRPQTLDAGKPLFALASLITLSCTGSSLAQELSAERRKSTLEEGFLKRDRFEVKGVHHTVAIPKNFPLPLYSSNVVATNFSNSTKGPVVAAASIITKDSVSTAFEWYKSQCTHSGWQLRTPKLSAMSGAEQKGQLLVLSALKGEQQCSIFCCQSTKHPNTVINISWMKHK